MPAHGDIEAYQFGLKEQRRSKGMVTTMVSASREEEDFARLKYPENAITVECSHTREVFDAEELKSRRSASDDVQKMNTGSTDEFFCR